MRAQSQTATLLEQARTLEESGRMDLAQQKWQQVLLADPNNAEGLAGLARAAKLQGRNNDAEASIERLLQEATQLDQAGQYERAMSILRRVYGDAPPPGNVAISYYQTEAATPAGRPLAVAGLRALVAANPLDARYQIALGKILTYNPRTRAEGRRLLERHPESADATEALRQSLVWDAQNPATEADIRRYLARHKDQQLATALAKTVAARHAAPKVRPPTADEIAAQEAVRARTSEDQAAYNALNAHRVNQAEAGFKAAIAKNPADAQALAGMGYVRMEQANFGGAISFLEQAEQEGAHDPAVEKGLRDSRFYFTMQEGTTALDANDLTTAQFEFHSALQIRPGSPEATLELGETLLKAQQAEAAIGVFNSYVQMRPGDAAGWRGLLTAEVGAERYAEALALDQRLPAAVHGDLMRDPDYLRTLASVYTAAGRDAEAQRVLQSALDLRFPADARGVKADTELQFAGLLAAAKRYEEASGLYRRVLAADTTNTVAWEGLIRTEHAMGQDASALQALGAMPAQNYRAAMQEPEFETMVASIYESQGQMDKAQQVLETFLAARQAQGRPVFVSAQLQLANIYMLRGNSQLAYPLYREVLSTNPDRADVWKGMLAAMQSAGNDREALAQVQQIPPAVRLVLEGDPAYFQTMGAIYAALGRPQEAASFVYRVQQYYAARRLTVPPDVDIQSAGLLYRSGNDAALYRALLALGDRADLTDDQRRTVQTIWANWAVRRAILAAQAGDVKRAQAVLNAAAQAFPGNADVTKALAGGYTAAGLPKRAVQIFRARGLSTGSAADYKTAVGAALADNDLKDAETWLRFGLEQYPRDAQLLALAARFETARGDPNRAAEYYRASLKALPPSDFGADLAGEMARPSPVPLSGGAQDLATLLGTATDGSGRPYLPGSGNTSPGMLPPIVPGYEAAPGYGAPGWVAPPGDPGAPDIGGQPAPAAGSGKPRDYVPQSRLNGEPEAIHLHPVTAVERVFGPSRTYDPSAEDVALVAVAGLHAAAFRQSTASSQSTTAADGTPIVPYAATATPARKKPTPSEAGREGEAARARAAAIRTNQDSALQDRTGVSRPPDDSYDAAQPGAQLDGAQFNPAQSQGAQSQQQAADAAARGQAGGTSAQQYPQPVTRTGQPPAGGVYPLPSPPTDQDLMRQNVPPLRGYYDPRPDQPPPVSERQQTELDLAALNGAYSGWGGASALGRYRSGTAGIDRLSVLETSGEASVIANRTVRFTIVPMGVFLNSGALNTSSGTLGTQPVLGTLPGNAISPPQQQFASGVGGEIQMATNTFSAAAGYTPYGFLVTNVIGRARWKPGNGHFTMYGGRDSVKETQLSWAGLRDPGSAFTNGNIWGGVVETGGGVRLDFGDEKAGLYVQGEGADLTGYHVLENRKFDGTAAASFRVKTWKEAGSLNVGGTMFGEHFDHNERGETYGLGGYFSPNVYFLAAVPVTFSGHQGTYFHYVVSGGVGIQTFQEASQIYFPLDLATQTRFAAGCATTVACAVFPVNSDTEVNYSVDTRGAYQVTDRWFVGAFVSGNNTNHYNTVSGGFFARYTFRPEYPTADYPTGFFPVEGFRAVKVP